MNLTEPMLSVIPSVTGSVLAVLARTTESLTGRGVARLVKPPASHRQVATVLAQLVEEGLVERVDKGRSALFTLNRDHVAAAPVGELAALRQVTLERLGSALGSWAIPPVSATVFGSFARGEGTSASDIDLLLVRPSSREDDAWSEQLVELTMQVHRWTGNPLNVIEIGDEELGRFAAEGFVQGAAGEGLTVAGTSLRRLLRSAGVSS